MLKDGIGFSLGAVLVATQPAPAMAQSAAQVEESQTADILVTARKRSERLSEIPESIQAFDSDALERSQVSNVQDVAVSVPNLSIVQSQNPGNVAISIRGISQARNQEPPIAFVVDGVQTASPNSITQELVDIERIEVLKGPQGAIYGRNAIGGAINITTKQPTNELSGSVLAEIGNGGLYNGQASLSGAIVDDKLLFRVSGSWRDFNGLIQNVTLNKTVDDVDEQTVRGKLIYKPTNRLTLDLRASYDYLSGGSGWYFPVFPGQSAGTRNPVESNLQGSSTRKLFDASAKIDYEFDTFNVSSITAYQSVRDGFFQDFDLLRQPLTGVTQSLRVNAISQEVRASSSRGGPLKWSAGAYYLHTDRKVDTDAFFDVGIAPFGTPLFSLKESNSDNAYAVFGQVQYRFAPALELSLAARQDWDQRRQLNVLSGGRLGETFQSFQPKANLSYFIGRSQIYVSAGKGFRSGGFNAPSPSFQNTYQAENARTYEIGTKFVRRGLALNLAGFYTDYTNQQTFFFVAATASQGIRNINRSRIYGVEGDFNWQPIKGLSLAGGFGVLDTKILDFDGTTSFVGNQIPFVNQWSYFLNAQYDAQVSDSITVSPRVEYNAQGDLAWQLDNATFRNAVHLVNTRLTIQRGQLAITGYVENVFDRYYDIEYAQQNFTGFPTDIAFPSKPRQYGISVRYKF